MRAPKLYARAKRIRAARQTKEEARNLEFDIEDADIYSVSGVEQLLDNDDISPEEAAFMEG